LCECFLKLFIFKKSKFVALVAAATIATASAQTCPLNILDLTKEATGTFYAGNGPCGTVAAGKVALLLAGSQAAIAYAVNMSYYAQNVTLNEAQLAAAVLALKCTDGVNYLTAVNRCSQKGCNANFTALCTAANVNSSEPFALAVYDINASCATSCAALFTTAASGLDYNATKAPTKSAASSLEGAALAAVSILAAVLSF